MKKHGSIKRWLLVLLLFGASLLFTVYPWVANYLFENRTDSVANAIDQTAQEIDTSEQDAALQAAYEYNRKLATGHVALVDPFIEEKNVAEADEYYALLNVGNDGVMCTIEIPVIDVYLPVYHGTSDDVLNKGVGHLQGTSLPIGGESTHSVLTGHTGLSKAKLFTDLTELKKEDIFFVHIFGETLAYRVEGMQVVLPDELDDLTVQSGQDLCTLVTCTPYGVNSHRLLVRGVRTDYQEAKDEVAKEPDRKVESNWMNEYKRALCLSIFCFISILAVVQFIRVVRTKRNQYM